MPNTRVEIEDEVFTILAETELSTEYTPARVQAKIDSVHKRICSGKLIRLFNDDPREGKAIRAKSLPFLNQQIPLTVFRPTTLTAPMNIGDTTVSLDTTDYEAAGAVYIAGNIVEYTSKSTTQFLGCTGIQTFAETGTTVGALTKVNSIDAYKPKTLWLQSKGIQRQIQYIRRGDQTGAEYWTILNNGTSKYINIISSTIGVYWLYYQLEPTTLTTDNQQILLPGTAGLDIVAPIVAGELLRKSEEIELAKEKLIPGYDGLTEFYGKFVADTQDEAQQISWDTCTAGDFLGAPLTNRANTNQL